MDSDEGTEKGGEHNDDQGDKWRQDSEQEQPQKPPHVQKEPTGEGGSGIGKRTRKQDKGGHKKGNKTTEGLQQEPTPHTKEQEPVRTDLGRNKRDRAVRDAVQTLDMNKTAAASGEEEDSERVTKKRKGGVWVVISSDSLALRTEESEANKRLIRQGLMQVEDGDEVTSKYRLDVALSSCCGTMQYITDSSNNLWLEAHNTDSAPSDLNPADEQMAEQTEKEVIEVI